MAFIEDITKLRFLYKLKSVYRFSSQDDRKESAAEHTWSSLVLADFFLSRMNESLNRQKVFDLLLYHDVAEIIADDTPLHPEMSRSGKEDREWQAIEEIKSKLPKRDGRRVLALFSEFEAQKSREAMFAKAIDALDAEIHELDYKADWKGWDEAFLRRHKQHLVRPFPELNEAFEELLTWQKENGYFDQ